ncbi:hypothetical protein EJ05DRAFT_496539 [Pseudovirgaria hyperparasitica]|uniref:Pal1-domain-containing protein n=1 Tax=Pseudovirgaria hyperparasitica TaxID=470096 RepID=A0A6A6WI16_9PEZI|nr:uncharacterized protein EJ05DRAFT_496539 [Pseudovirgaria hyperparasitica]KAF2761636.1 hypothetical protein EJ05DRAFT_496539 [Pseudovirgaria hyperparasitica]
MPIRNPFKKTLGEVEVRDENQPFQRRGPDGGFQSTYVTGAKPIEIKEPTEYKLSEINDSGVFLPPSPTEKKSFWGSRSNTSTTSSSNHRSLLNENEPFNISRESFDSYRRSFDISARSPISEVEPRLSREYGRQSLDARRAIARPSRSSFDHRIDRPEAMPEEGFEEVGLNDEVKPKKRGLFSRFGDSSDSNHANHSSDSRPSSSHHGFHLLPGRKRGQSGQGSELRPMANSTPEIKVDS